MKKKLFVLFFCSSIFTHGQITFITTFDNCAPNWFQPLIETNDNGYLFSGYWNDSFITKTDSAGNVMWVKEFGIVGVESITSIAQSSDGGYIMCGTYDTAGGFWEDIFLVKTNTIGVVQWMKTYKTIFPEFPVGIVEMSDSGLLIVANQDPNLILIRTNSTGDTLWTKLYSSIGYIWKAQNTNDKGFILTGRGTSQGMTLVKIDSSGNLVLAKDYVFLDAEGHGVCETQDNGMLLTGCIDCVGPQSDMINLKVDSIGQIVWSKKFTSQSREASECIKQSFNDFIITGFIQDTIDYDYGTFLVKIDSAGDSVWTKKYPIDSGGLDLSSTSDGGYIISAEKSNQYASLIKTDHVGQTFCGEKCFHFSIQNISVQTFNINVSIYHPTLTVSTLSVLSANHILNQNTLCSSLGIESNSEYSESIYLCPNPFHCSATLKTEAKFTMRDIQLKIYNSIGILVRVEKVLNITSYILDRKNLNDGLYFYELRTTDSELIGTGKFVIE